MGHIYKPKYKDKKTKEIRESAIWWIKYYRNGKPYRESTKSVKESDAKRLLRKREGDIANGKLPGIYFDKVLFDELAEDFLLDYRINKKKSLDRAELSVKHLKEMFEGERVVNISTSKVQKYIENRLKSGASNGTVKRELAALRRMLNLGAKYDPPKVNRVPYIPKLEEDNVRKGYFKADAFEAIYKLLPDYLKPAVKIAYTTGMPFGEITSIKWQQVNLDRGAITLNPGETKNKRGRIIYLLSDEIEMLTEQRTKMEKRKVLCPYVFPSADGKEKIGDIRKAWNTACSKAGIGYGYATTTEYVNKWAEKLPPGPLFHDFRRTAVRNMSRAGISRPIAMKRSGHKTESVYNRYDIDNEADQQAAAQMLENYLNNQTVKVTGKVINFEDKKESTDNG